MSMLPIRILRYTFQLCRCCQFVRRDTNQPHLLLRDIETQETLNTKHSRHVRQGVGSISLWEIVKDNFNGKDKDLGVCRLSYS
jgi:hypothetical protein